jgi:hypothetical protein
MKSIQETFIDLYYKSKQILDKDKYNDACNTFQNLHKMKPPYSSYISFKNNYYKWIKRN